MDRDIGDSLLVFSQLCLQLFSSDVFGGILKDNGEIGCTDSFITNSIFLLTLIVLKDKEHEQPHDHHSQTDPALNIIIGFVCISWIELLRPQR